jgi:hypothetical protein
MKTIPFFLPLLLLLFSNCHTHDEPLQGLWLVTKVEAQGQSMTPNGKWIELSPEGAYASGNGWRKHSSGHWRTNAAHDSLWIDAHQTPVDPFGGFQMRASPNSLELTRWEDGLEVLIHLKPIETIPAIAADSLIGVWMQTDNPDLKYFFRWDHIFEHKTASGDRSMGTYRVNPHRNELQIRYFSDTMPNLQVPIRFEADRMIWEGDEDNSWEKSPEF